MMIMIIAMIIMIVMMVILMIMMKKLPKKHTNIMTFQQKCTNFRDFYLVKKGPKNLGIGKPPPPTFGQCPKVSDFFLWMPSLRILHFCRYKHEIEQNLNISELRPK